MDLFGTSRSHRARDHALIAPESFVRAPLPGWERMQGVILISPRMGARFTQFLALMEPGGTAAPAAPGVERVLYVLDGRVEVQPSGEPERTLTAGGYAFVPPDDAMPLRAATTSRLNL